MQVFIYKQKMKFNGTYVISRKIYLQDNLINMRLFFMGSLNLAAITATTPYIKKRSNRH